MTHADRCIHQQDYARAIQEERKVLIKAMMKARKGHGLKDANAKGRYLLINNNSLTLKVFPSILNNLNLMLFTCKRMFSFHR